MKKTIQQCGLITVIILLLTTFAQPVFALIDWSGNLDPNDPTTWTSSTYAYIGKTSDGTLGVNEGDTVVANRSYIGNDPCSTGEVTIDGVGSTWTNTFFIYIGNYGDGILDITDGGTVNNSNAFVAYRADSNSSVTVEGPNSLWNNTGGIYIGRGGNGTLDVNDGGEVKSNGESSIGYSDGSTGEVTVNGIGSKWTNNFSSYVGYYGDGTMNITNGGVASSSDGYISRYSGSTSDVTVDGPNSMWNITGGNGALTIGLLGNGTLEITDGGAVSNNYGYLGSNPDSTGEVNVDGPGSTWTNNKYLNVGYYGNGTLNVTGAGTVISEWDGNIGYESGSTGAVTIDGPGSTWTNNQALYVGCNGSGTLTISNGGLVSVNLALNLDTNLNGDGFINIASGGKLAKKGNANGTLAGFLALVSGTDAIRYWHSTFGNWDDITSATLNVDYTLTYLTEGDLAGYTVLTVHVPGPPDPDVHRDGVIDMLDFADFTSQWLDVNCIGPDWCGRADIDYSGDVGFSDLQILTENWLDGVE